MNTKVFEEQSHLDRVNDWISVNGGRKGPLGVAMELAELDEANDGDA